MHSFFERRTQKCKKIQSSHQSFLGSAHVEAANKILVKSTLDVQVKERERGEKNRT